MCGPQHSSLPATAELVCILGASPAPLWALDHSTSVSVQIQIIHHAIILYFYWTAGSYGVCSFTSMISNMLRAVVPNYWRSFVVGLSSCTPSVFVCVFALYLLVTV